MTQPRRILPGMTVMVTRRALRRTMLLRPDAQLNNLFVYCLAVLSAHFGILVHHVVVMSNHYHLVLTDSRGQLPNFMRDLNRLLALGIKALRKWEGAVWEPNKPSVVELRTAQAVLEEIAYATANPSAAFAVSRCAQWPGLNVLPDQLGCARLTAKRPDFYFNERNPKWPAVATLELTMPPIGLTDAGVRDAVAREVERLEGEARIALQLQGRRVLGPQKVVAMSPYERATSREPLRGRNPRFATGRGQRDAFFEAVRVLRDFRRTYRDALGQWRAGSRTVLFPLGTWFMRWAHGAALAPS